MGRSLIANLVFVIILVIMFLSAIWVMVDSRKRGRPWDEVLAWGLFAGSFLVLGPAIYIFWNRKFPK